MLNLGKALADELGPQGVRVNTISPGPVLTPLWTALGLDAQTGATEKGLYPGLQTVLRQQRSGTVHRRLRRVHSNHALLASGDQPLVASGAAAPSL